MTFQQKPWMAPCLSSSLLHLGLIHYLSKALSQMSKVVSPHRAPATFHSRSIALWLLLKAHWDSECTCSQSPYLLGVRSGFPLTILVYRWNTPNITSGACFLIALLTTDMRTRLYNCWNLAEKWFTKMNSKLSNNEHQEARYYFWVIKISLPLTISNSK